ncbi:hypothetical protein [Paenibacillus uliginis]|nr:hypothetical protein [Paenibacillus uliginis]
MSKKRIVIESVVFSTVICFGYILFMVIQGYILTKNDVPDIINSYNNVEYLQQKVAFGVINRGGGWIYAIGAFILLALTYGTIRWRLKRKL